jgi:DNA-binding transcriptional regulator YhcF (GntR family)
MNPFKQHDTKKSTARCRIAAILTQEILSRSDSKDFPIASEHQLCQRFGVSRVTIRLAFADLEHRRLIYRRHGKGTFAHACSTRVHPSLGILTKSPDALKSTKLIDFIRGALTVMTSLRSSIVLINTHPRDWQTEMTSTLGGVVILEGEFTADELDSLKNRRLPFISLSEMQPSLEDKDYFRFGMCAAKTLDQAVATGEPVPADQWSQLSPFPEGN